MAMRNATERSGRPTPIISFYDPYVKGGDAHGRTLEQMLKWDDELLERSHDYIQVLFPLPEGSMFNYNAPLIDSRTIEAFRARFDLQLYLNNAFLLMMKFYGFAVIIKWQNQGKETLAQAPNLIDGKGKGKGVASKAAVEPDSSTTTKLDTQPESSLVLKPVNIEDEESIAFRALARMLAQENGSDEPPIGVQDSTDPEDIDHIEKDHLWETKVSMEVVRGVNFDECSENWCVRMDHNHLRITRILRSLRVLGLQAHCEAFYNALKDVYNDPKIKIGERSMLFWTRAVREPLHIAPDGEECKWLKEWLNEEEHD